MANGTAIGTASIIFIVFFTLAIFLPFIYEGFDQDSVTVDAEGFTQDVGQDQNSITLLSFVFSITKVFFWSFGTFPFWLDGILTIFRVLFFISLYVIIRGGN